jgi:hypothetical protein
MGRRTSDILTREKMETPLPILLNQIASLDAHLLLA